MITIDEMKSAVVKLRAEKRKLQEKINFYNLCIKASAKGRRQSPKPEIDRMCLAALIDYVENGTKPVAACKKTGMAKHRWGIHSIERAWRRYFPEHYWHIYDTEYMKDQKAGENYNHGSYIRVFPPLITSVIRKHAISSTNDKDMA